MGLLSELARERVVGTHGRLKAAAAVYITFMPGGITSTMRALRLYRSKRVIGYTSDLRFRSDSSAISANLYRETESELYGGSR
jgi:hypothetical protein